MGSKSKAITVGYRYYMGLHMGLSLTADALLEIQVGDRSAWSGYLTENGDFTINAPQLFGGDKREGGVAGVAAVMFGRPDQVPNAYLGAQHGNPNPAYRGFLGLVFYGPSSGEGVTVLGTGPYGTTLFNRYTSGYLASLNPYVKPWAARVRSIVQGWYGGTCWYEAKAPIPLVAPSTTTVATDYTDLWAYRVEEAGSTADYSSATYNHDAWSVGAGGFGTAFTGRTVGTTIAAGLNRAIWLRRRLAGLNGDVTLTLDHDDSAKVWWNGVLVGDFGVYGTSTIITVPAAQVTGDDVVAVQVVDSLGGGNIYGGLTASSVSTDAGVLAMNPAHIIYQALTDPDWGMGYPATTIDAASFAAAADTLYAEGFGLCLKWANQASIQEFTQIVADHAGLVYGQDRRTGKFRMLLLRGDYDPDTLRVFTSADVRVRAFQRPSLADTVNEVLVTYVDVATGKEATTAPLQNLANIQGQGRVVSQTLSFPGLPTHDLAVRVGLRELAARSTPLWRFSLEFKRIAHDLLPGEPFMLDLLDVEGIGVRLVMRAGEIDYGETGDRVIRGECFEDVFGLPAAGYVTDPGPGAPPPSTAPLPATAATFEVPYRDLVGVLSAYDLANLPAAAGYLGAVAVLPSAATVNFDLYTRQPPDDYADAATGDFAPSTTLAADLPVETGPSVLSVDPGSLLGELVVGSAAFLGEGASAELVRIDAVDTSAMTVTVGRGCGDTTPAAWPAGTRLWGYGTEAAEDRTQYADGETVNAKVAPTAAGGVLSLALAEELTVVMASRAARPYPPGALTVNGTAYPTSASADLTVAWAHRDRGLQADDLVDSSEADVGPEAGTTYTVTYEQPPGTVVHTESGLTGTSGTPYTLAADGQVRVAVTAQRDGLDSWQALAHTFDYSALPLSVRVVPGGNRRTTPSGDVRVSRG